MCSLGSLVPVRSSQNLYYLDTMARVAYQSTYEAVVDIVKSEGFFGLYSGVGSSLVGIAITNGYVPILSAGPADRTILVCLRLYAELRLVFVLGPGPERLQNLLLLLRAHARSYPHVAPAHRREGLKHA